MPPGVDITRQWKDIERLARAYYRAPQTQEYLRARAKAGHAGRRIEADDFVQEVALAIHRKNGTAGAFDPSRGKLGTYVWRVCFSVASHGTERLDSESLLPDPASMGKMARADDGLATARRAMLESNNAVLASLARSRAADRRAGQLALFSPEQECPFLEDVTDAA